jgi:2-polyprenyl-3-methyl-5-hydroxy-6-metoxy-1,4-benzoquinol methylase
MKYDFQFDEMHQVGADHTDLVRATEYDNKMQMFRNYNQEARHLVHELNITDQMSILDIGAGTGALSIELAAFCREITAIDVSNIMLQILETKAGNRAITNIRTCNKGFLTFDSCGKKYDRIISNAVMHHLPDFWKCIALRRVHSMLEDNGLFSLSDVVFSFSIDNYESEMDTFLIGLKERTDEEFVKDGVLHFKEEFSTFDWLLDSMIEKTGFAIVKKKIGSATFASYILRKA